MKEIELLELEIKLLQDNIKRLKEYLKENNANKYKPYQSNVVGELKHRAIALKQRLTQLCKITTRDLF